MTPRRAVALAAALAAALALARERADAQVHASFLQIGTYDDNSFAFREKRADVYHQSFLALSLDRSAEGVFVQYYYYGAGVLFRTYDTRSYHKHTLGAYVQIQLDYRDDESGTPGENGDDASVDETTRDAADVEGADSSDAVEADSSDAEDVDSSDTSDADSSDTEDVETSEKDGQEGGGIAEREIGMPPAAAEPAFNDSLVTYLVVKPAVSGRFDRVEWDFYDYLSGGAGAFLRRHIAGPLMARLSYEVEVKSYPHLAQFSHVEQIATLTASARTFARTEFFATASFGVKHYTGSTNDTSFDVGGAGSGKGKGGVGKGRQTVYQVSTPAASQLAIAAGVVETLAPALQCTLSLERRTNPANDARYLDPRVFSSTTEDEIFEDRYGYQSTAAGAALAATLFGACSLACTLTAEWKAYPRSAADIDGFALPGAAQRRDRRWSAGATVTLPLVRRADGSALLTGGAQYAYHRNESNDTYHDYSIHQIALQAQVDF